MKRLILKTATVFLCMGISACSSFNKPDSKAEADKTASKAVKTQPVVTKAWLDEQETLVRETLKGSHFEVSRRDNLLVVTAPVDRSFNPDRPSMLLPATLGPVTKVAKLVEKNDKISVLILGHADSSGAASANRKLSEERARAMAAIFRLSGLKGDRLAHKGMGADLPLASNDDKKGRSTNRRVEMLLTPRGTLPGVLAEYNTVGKRLVAADQAK